MIFIILVILIDYIFLIYASSREYENKLQSYVVSRLVYMSVFAPILLNYFGIITNAGAVLYGSVMVAQCIIMKKYGEKIALRILQTALFTLFMIIGLGFAVYQLPIFTGNESFNYASKILLAFSPQNIYGSFFAFIISQNILIQTYKRLKFGFVLKSFLAIILAQVIDTIIFFLIAFYNSPILINLMLNGLAVKISLALIFLPILYLVDKKYI